MPLSIHIWTYIICINRCYKTINLHYIKLHCQTLHVSATFHMVDHCWHDSVLPVKLLVSHWNGYTVVWIGGLWQRKWDHTAVGIGTRPMRAVHQYASDVQLNSTSNPSDVLVFAPNVYRVSVMIEQAWTMSHCVYVWISRKSCWNVLPLNGHKQRWTNSG